jgi:hypothetical protein
MILQTTQFEIYQDGVGQVFVIMDTDGEIKVKPGCSRNPFCIARVFSSAFDAVDGVFHFDFGEQQVFLLHYGSNEQSQNAS